MTNEDLKKGLYEALNLIGERQKVLAIPPDYTRLPSRAGEPDRNCLGILWQ